MRKIQNPKTKLAVFLLLPVLYLIMYLLDTTCIVKSILGVPCPGCGMTRAAICAIRLDFIGAFEYHAMFWSLPLLVLYFLYDGCVFRNKKINAIVLATIALGFFLNWLIRFLL